MDPRLYASAALALLVLAAPAAAATSETEWADWNCKFGAGPLSVECEGTFCGAGLIITQTGIIVMCAAVDWPGWGARP